MQNRGSRAGSRVSRASGEGATDKTEALQKSEERMVERLCEMRLTDMFL